MVRGRWVMLLLPLAAPARAEPPEGGWTHDLDLSAGLGAGAVSVALGEVSALGLFGGRLRLGAGSRLLGVFGASALALGRKDRGTLDSEFFVGWWFDERVAVRAGASHLVSELVTAQPLQDGNDRFRRSSTLFLVAVTVRP